MGNSGYEPVNQLAFQYSGTQSLFSFEAGGVHLEVTFLSPVTPQDLRRQSLTFSYLSVEATTADHLNHDVQLYSDISAGKFDSLVVSCISVTIHVTGPRSDGQILTFSRMGLW